MNVELMKRMMDACYQGKRIRDMLPPLPDGVASSFIQYLDIIEKLEKQGQIKEYLKNIMAEIALIIRRSE